MREATPEIIDLALTQALERYIDMEPGDVVHAITVEWPEQIAVLLTEVLFRSTCGGYAGTASFIHRNRKNGHSTYLIPICSCNLYDGRQK